MPLREKLKEIEQNDTISQSSPKALYGILVIANSAMEIGLIFSYLSGFASTLGLYLGLSFIISALIIFNQYKKEK